MRRFIATCLTVLFATFAMATQVAAINIDQQACDSISRTGGTSAVCQNQGENIRDKKFITALTNTLLFILGIAAVIVIVIGGLRYATANGDPQKITSAKNTIMYAVVGLIVAVMAWAIVTFVVTSVAGNNSGSQLQAQGNQNT